MKVIRKSIARQVFNATRRQLRRAVTEGTQAAVDEMKRRVPVKKGDLQSTIEMKQNAPGKTTVSAGGKQGKSGKFVDYQDDVEFGTADTAAQAYFRPGLDQGVRETRSKMRIVKR